MSNKNQLYLKKQQIFFSSFIAILGLSTILFFLLQPTFNLYHLLQNDKTLIFIISFNFILISLIIFIIFIASIYILIQNKPLVTINSEGIFVITGKKYFGMKSKVYKYVITLVNLYLKQNLNICHQLFLNLIIILAINYG